MKLNNRIVPFKPRPPRPAPTHDELAARQGIVGLLARDAHHKNPVSGVVDAQDVEACTDAVIYYTGTVPALSATSEPDRLRLSIPVHDALDLGTTQVLTAVRGGAETARGISDATGLDTKLVSRCLRRLVHRRQLRKLSAWRYATR